MFLTATRISLLALMLTTPALADAVTYSGTIGDAPVLVELTELADGPLLGRLTRLADGIDVPLQPVAVSDTTLELAEEVSCLLAICPPSETGIFDPPLGARLTLRFEGGDLVGLWSTGSQQEPVQLAPVGKRLYERYDTYAYQAFVWKSYDGPLSIENSPYDYLKMQVPLEEGPAVDMGVGTAVRMMTDPRTRFAFPRLSPVQGGPDTEPVNRTLRAMHWETNLRGFSCLSMRYLSAGWHKGAGEMIGTLGFVDEELASVEYLSAKVMSMVQSGSLFCAGSAFYNHIDYTTLDVETGEAFDLSRVFRGWVASKDGQRVDLETARRAPQNYSWGPDEMLAAFVREHIDPGMDGCDTAANISDYLDISFSEGAVAVFRIEGIDELPCEGEIFSARLADLKPLLTEEAFEIFPDLED
jgi:hypothetical protein